MLALFDLPAPSWPLLYGFWTLLVATLLAAAAMWRRYAGASTARAMLVLGAWLAVGGVLSVTGATARWELRPPPMLVYVFAGFVAVTWLARRPAMRRIAHEAPLGLLIAFQGFRFPLELLLHRAYRDGLMPVQMSFEGYNFDIFTGLSAIALGVLALRGALPRALAWAFQILGVGLLLNIVTIAIACTPVFAAFGPEAVNTWVADIPFVWLPAVFVNLAWLGHLLIFDRLRATGVSATAAT